MLLKEGQGNFEHKTIHEVIFESLRQTIYNARRGQSRKEERGKQDGLWEGSGQIITLKPQISCTLIW